MPRLYSLLAMSLLAACAQEHVSPRDLVGETPLAASPALTGDVARGGFGNRVACAGDLDGDGHADLAVGAHLDSTAAPAAGAVYVFHGPVREARMAANADAVLIGEAAMDEAGISVAGAGDVNGDGAADLIVGAYNPSRAGREGGAGAAYLVFGPVSGRRSLADADVKLEGEAADDHAGFVVVAAGDLDDDGVADIAVSAFHGEGRGKVYVLYGPLARGTRSLASADAVIVSELEGDHAGLALAGGGDLTGDGVDDLAIGAPLRDDGAVYVVSRPGRGRVRLADVSVRLEGASPREEAGTSLAIGDMNGDGRDDLLVGAPASSRSAARAGALYLVAGPIAGDRSLEASHAILVGARAGDGLGISVVGGFDRDRDGTNDVLVGAWGADEAGEEAGAGYLFYGPLAAGTTSASAADARLPGIVAGDIAGTDVAACPGPDGTVLAIGAPGASRSSVDSGAVVLLP